MIYFNNLLGAIIGYGIVIGIIKIKEKRVKRSFLYFIPLLLVVILFASMFTYYHLKEFGNLSIISTYRNNMTQAATTIDTQLDDDRITVPVYKAHRYTKAAADEFIMDFFEKNQLDLSKLEVIAYQNEGVYWIRDEITHNIWFRYLDGSYSYKDFSSFNNGMEPKDVDEETIIDKLSQYGIHIPQGSLFHKADTGSYEWTVDQKVIENQLIDGALKVDYYNDDSGKMIENHLITYDKVKDVQIKSEQEAYEKISNGKFQYYSNNKTIESLHIDKVELNYHLDPKATINPFMLFIVQSMDRKRRS